MPRDFEPRTVRASPVSYLTARRRAASPFFRAGKVAPKMSTLRSPRRVVPRPRHSLFLSVHPSLSLFSLRRSLFLSVHPSLSSVFVSRVVALLRGAIRSFGPTVPVRARLFLAPLSRKSRANVSSSPREPRAVAQLSAGHPRPHSFAKRRQRRRVARQSHALRDVFVLIRRDAWFRHIRGAGERRADVVRVAPAPQSDHRDAHAIASHVVVVPAYGNVSSAMSTMPYMERWCAVSPASGERSTATTRRPPLPSTRGIVAGWSDTRTVSP